MILEDIYQISRENDRVNSKISQTIIDELLEHGKFSLTVTQVSDRVGCSQPTVSRYVQRVNLKSYKQMVKEINLAAPRYFSKSIEYQTNLSVSKCEIINSINKTLKNLDDTKTQRIAQMILNSNKINVVGMGGNFSIKTEIEHKLSQVGKSPMLAIDWHQQMINLNYMDENDLVIIISYSGDKEETIQIAKEASLKKIPVLLFTGNFESTLEQYATYKITIYSNDPKYRSFSFSSRPAIFSAWEIIFKEILLLDDLKEEIIEAWKWKKDRK